MHRLVAKFGSSVDDGPCVDLNSDCRHKCALKLVCVYEESHWLDSHCISRPACHREYRCILDHVSDALWVRDVDLQAWVIYLDERRQAHLVVTLLWFVETESMVNRWHGRHDVQVLRHRRLPVV